MSCGTTEIAWRRLCWVTREISWPSMVMLPCCDVVEALQQHEQGGLSAAGLADQPDPLSGLKTQVEAVEYLEPAGIVERNVVEGDGGAALDQRLGLGMVAQFMRLQQRCDRFRQPGDMLGDVDQRDREIARRDAGWKGRACRPAPRRRWWRGLLPERDRPVQQRERQHDA